MSTSFSCVRCGQWHPSNNQCDPNLQLAHLTNMWQSPKEPIATDMENQNVAKYNLWRDGHK